MSRVSVTILHVIVASNPLLNVRRINADDETLIVACVSNVSISSLAQSTV